VKQAPLYVVVLLVLCGLTSANADVYTFPITGDWLGVYDANEYWQAPMDFGKQFSSIQSVSVSWSGTVTSGYDDFLIPVRGRFACLLIEDANVVMALAYTSWSPQSYSFPTASFNTQTALTTNSWSFLTDGRSDLRIYYEPENNDYTSSDVPWGNLESASLILSGTAIVPEPGSLPSMALGLAGLAAAFRRRT